MRKRLLALCALMPVGCATTPQYGNFTQQTPVTVEQKIAADAVKQLVTLHAPGKTRFMLRQPTPDAFGTALLTGLRQEGYVVLEFSPPKTAPATAGSPSQNASAVPLHYVLDQLDQAERLYRVTLRVGTQSISRPYVAENGTAQPAGYWARRE